MLDGKASKLLWNLELLKVKEDCLAGRPARQMEGTIFHISIRAPSQEDDMSNSYRLDRIAAADCNI